MTDNILDNYMTNRSNEEFDRDVRLSSMNLQTSPKQDNLANIYQSIFKTYYSVFGSADELSCKDVLGGLLMIFRFITIDQFSILFPAFGPYRISRLCQKDDSNKKPFFSSSHFNGQTSFYFLNESGHKHYRTYFPDKYLEAARIPITPGSLPAPSRAVHDIRLRDVPYGFIALKSFKRFDWYTSIPLPSYQTPSEAVKAIKDKNYIQQTRSSKKGELVADGIILFSNSQKSFIVEQDAGTENTEILKKKIVSYEDYLNSLEKPQDVNIIFNVCVPSSNKKKNNKNNLHLSTFRKLELLMTHDNITMLDVFYDKLNEWIIENKPMKKTLINMKKLLDEYVKAGNSLSNSLYSLEKYINKERLKDSLNSQSSSLSTIFRKNLIKKLVLEALNEQKYNNTLLEAVSKGTQLIVTDCILRSARFIFPYESGLLSDLGNQLKTQYGYDYSLHSSITCDNHCIGCGLTTISKQDNRKIFYTLIEISNNVGAYYNLVNMLNTFTKREHEIHLLIMVSSVKDAMDFVKETNCINKYCSSEDIQCPNPSYNLTIRFMEYNPNLGPNQSFNIFLPNGRDIEKARLL